MLKSVNSQLLIQLHRVNLYLARKHVLRDVDLSVKRGEHLTIIGPNGAGKTTLLKVMLGLLKPDQGTVVTAPHLTIGYAPQSIQISPILPLTVMNFLQLVKGSSKADIATVLAEVGVSSIAKSMLHGLSGGELQRVLLARALLHDPQLLVLDEPAQNLDVSGQLAFYRLLNRIQQERRCTIVMVSHDLHFVMATTHRVICFYHHVCCAGQPDQVARTPQFAELFGQDAATWLALYQHDHNHTHHPLGVEKK